MSKHFHKFHGSPTGYQKGKFQEHLLIQSNLTQRLVISNKLGNNFLRFHQEIH